VAANVAGGIESDSDFAGDVYAGLVFDLDQMLGWKGTTFKLSGIDRHGNSIDGAVGGQYSVMQCVGGQSTMLYEVQLEKTFGDSTAVKAGRMSATDDFVGSPLYGYSLNNAVNGQIRAVLFDGVMTSYPFPVWGVRLKYESGDEHKLMVGTYQLTEEMWNPVNQGTDFSFSSDDGVSLFTQYDWMPEVGGRPARFYVGMNNAWFDMQAHDGGTTDYLFRFYAHGDIEVADDIITFLTFAYSPQDEVAIMPIQSTLGVNCKGLFPGRPDDRTMLFATYGQFSDELAGDKDFEMPIEVGHRFQITPSIYAQPSIQYVVNPGGTGDIDDALVIGVQAGVTLF
jgi:porin